MLLIVLRTYCSDIAWCLQEGRFMQLSVSYNFFNGEEHLIPSLRSVRSNVDFISVVYQKTSNSGEKISESAMDSLFMALKDGLIDCLFDYNPNLSLKRNQNELLKRKIGLNLALQANCTHFLLWM